MDTPNTSRKAWPGTLTDVAAIAALTVLAVSEQIEGSTALAVISIIAGAWLIKKPGSASLVLACGAGLIETVKTFHVAVGLFALLGRTLIGAGTALALSMVLFGCQSETLRNVSPCVVVTAAAELTCAVERQLTSGGESPLPSQPAD